MQKSRLRSGALMGRRSFFPCLDLFIRVPKTKKVNLSLYSPSGGVLYMCICNNMHPLPPYVESGAKKCTLFEIGRKKCLLFSAIKKLWQGTSVSVLLAWHQVNENIPLCCNTDSLSAKIVNLTPPHICPLYHSFFK